MILAAPVTQMPIGPLPSRVNLDSRSHHLPFAVEQWRHYAALNSRLDFSAASLRSR